MIHFADGDDWRVVRSTGGRWEVGAMKITIALLGAAALSIRAR